MGTGCKEFSGQVTVWAFSQQPGEPLEGVGQGSDMMGLYFKKMELSPGRDGTGREGATWKEADRFGSYYRVQVNSGKEQGGRGGKRGGGTRNACRDGILELDGWT